MNRIVDKFIITSIIPGKKLGSWDLDPNLKFGAGREIGDFGKRNTGFGKRNRGLQEEKWGFWEEK